MLFFYGSTKRCLNSLKLTHERPSPIEKRNHTHTHTHSLTSDPSLPADVLWIRKVAAEVGVWLGGGEGSDMDSEEEEDCDAEVVLLAVCVIICPVEVVRLRVSVGFYISMRCMWRV